MMLSDVSMSDICLTQWRIQNLCKRGGVASGRRPPGGGFREGVSPSGCAPPSISASWFFLASLIVGELVCRRVGVSASWFVGELSIKLPSTPFIVNGSLFTCVKCGKSPALFPAFYTYSIPHSRILHRPCRSKEIIKDQA